MSNYQYVYSTLHTVCHNIPYKVHRLFGNYRGVVVEYLIQNGLTDFDEHFAYLTHIKLR